MRYVITVILLSAFNFSFSYAAGLVPCGNTGASQCNWCDLIQLIQNLINYAIYLGVLIAAIVFAYGGGSYMISGTTLSDFSLVKYGESGYEHAKSMLTGALYGLVFIMIGWLVVDTLLKALVDDAKFGVWNSIKCERTNPVTEGGYDLSTNPRPSSSNPYDDRRR